MCPEQVLQFWTAGIRVGVPPKINSFIRRLSLDIAIFDRSQEEEWNIAFGGIAHDLQFLQYVYLEIEMNPYEDHDLKEWHSSKPSQNSFLYDLRKLGDLELKDVSITLSDSRVLESDREAQGSPEELKQNRWTMAQKQEWAAYFTRVLLRQKYSKPAAADDS